jgi:predicted ATPase/signal transduction histidine kinase
MSDQGAYLVEAPLDEGAPLGLYRALRARDRAPVLLRVPFGEPPTNRDIERLRREYDMTRALADVGDVLHAAALERLPGRGPVLVLENFAGELLGSRLGRPLTVEAFLRLAVPMARVLSEIHAHGVLHKDVSPASWLVHAPTGQVRLTDLGLADFFPDVAVAPNPSGVIEGRLAYMSPERWGRLNRPLGPESDLYSLGIVFYEMLTGALPFQARDPVRWAHLHTARQPIPPVEAVPGLPALLSSIVEKLMAKNAEDRYPSALVLARDLERCLSAVRTGGRIEPFPLAPTIESEILRPSHALYGRTGVVDEVLGSFDRVRAEGTRRWLFVSGASGTGKSTVVAAALAQIASRGGRVAAGKFDQYAQRGPYGPIAGAFDRLVRAFLMEGAAENARWAESLRAALGPNAPLLAELVPHLQRILGSSAGPEPTSTVLTRQNRVHLGFRALAAVLATEDRPIVLFLDDLQWTDEASLALVDHIAGADARHLYVIGAYRENEIGAEHPLRVLLAATANTETTQTLSIGPFPPAEFEQFVADSLRERGDNVRYLANLVHSKTGGNPFFAIQFLQSLCQRRLLRFDVLAGRWLFNPRDIEAEAVTDNIVPWLIDRLRTLSDVAQSALMLAACLGNRVEGDLLAAAWNRPEGEVHSALAEPVRQGQLVRTGRAYTFVHDRIQQAAYSMIPEVDRAATHREIARRLHAWTPPERMHERVFQIADHYNLGRPVARDVSEASLVFEINVLAGRKAKAASAYAVAASYFQKAFGLLGGDSWQTRYDATYRLFLDGGECEYIEGRFEQSESLLAEVVEHATSIDAAPARAIQMHLHSLGGRFERAIETAVSGLSSLDFDLSSEPTQGEIDEELRQIWEVLGDRTIESLIDLPPMTDRRAKAAMDILATANTVGLLTNPSFFNIVQIRSVSLGLRYGNADTSPVTYQGFGMILRDRLGRYEDAYRFGKLGLDLAERNPQSPYRARTLIGFSTFILPWKESSAPAFGMLERAFQLARQVGDLSLACYCSTLFTGTLVRRGTPLDEIDRKSEEALLFVRAAGYRPGENAIMGQRRLVLALRGRTSSLSSFDDAEVSEKDFEERIVSEEGPPLVACWYYITKLQARFLSGDYEQAVEAGTRAKAFLWAAQAFPEFADYVFYDALSLAARAAEVPSEARATMVAQVLEHVRTLRQWADHCPANFEGRHALVAAEAAGLDGAEMQALSLYEQAISGFRREGLVHEEALAYELLARFTRRRGLETFADQFVVEAIDRYRRWGAVAKVRQLEELHPRCARPRALPDAPISPDTWDVLSLVKASQSISTELETTDLVATLLRIMLEYAGAERVCLMFDDEGGTTLLAELSERAPASPVLRSAPLEGSRDLPQSIVHFVKRTHETVLLDDAAIEWAGGADPYIQRVRPKSVLCVPILRQSSVLAVLYLENNLTRGAFPRARGATIELLAEEVAISLQNNRLYSQLRRERDVLSRIMETVPVGIAVLDGKGRIFFANAEARGLVEGPAPGGPAEEGGFAAWRLLDFDGRPLAREDLPFVMALSTGRPVYDMRVAVDAPDRRFLSVNAAALPAGLGASTAPGVVATFQDLTEQVRLDAQRKAMEERLIVSDRLQSMGVLAAGVAHEINNPLMYCMANLTLMALEVEKLVERPSPTSADLHRHARDLLDLIATAENGVDRIRTIVADMRTFSRAEPAEGGPADVHRVLELTVKLAMGQLRGRATLVTDYRDVPPVDASESRLAQVFLNLLINALQSLPPTGESANEIRLTTRTDNAGRAVVEFRDTGSGIAPDIRSHIFDPFFTTKPVGVGSGLGLTICHSIVAQAGGEIEVESEPGSGSTFRVILLPHVVDPRAAPLSNRP